MTYSEGAHADGLQQAVDRLAARLGRSVAVDDMHGRLVASSRHFGDEDKLRVYAVVQRTSDPRLMAYFRTHDIYRWTTPGRIPANPELEFKARVCCPVRVHGIPFGHLFLIDESVEDWEIELATATADDIGLIMYRRLVLHEQAHGRRETLTLDLISTDSEARAAARRTLVDEQLIDVAEPVVAVSVHLLVPTSTQPGTQETTLRVALEHLTRGRSAGRTLTLAKGRRGSVLLFGDTATAEAGRSVAGRLAADLRRAGGIERVVAGLGTVRAGPDAAQLSHDEARLVAGAAVLLPSLGDVVDQENLGAYALLLAVPRHALTADLYPTALRRLLEQATSDSLVETLETYLDCCGDATRTAAELRVHRSTLYYRLGRIETITGVDLHDGRHRLALHLGVKLRRVLDAYGNTPDGVLPVLRDEHDTGFDGT
jgi:sugar diacid utilization regulator